MAKPKKKTPAKKPSGKTTKPKRKAAPAKAKPRISTKAKRKEPTKAKPAVKSKKVLKAKPAVKSAKQKTKTDRPLLHPLALVAEQLEALPVTRLRPMAGVTSKRHRKAELVAQLVACYQSPPERIAP